MQPNNRISKLVTSYLIDNDLSNRGASKQISTQLGIPDAISYNTIRNIRMGQNPRPTIWRLLAQQGTGSLKELAEAILLELEPDEVPELQA